MPKELPYFPFYVDDFSSDGKVEAMTTEEVGAYTLLLCKAWKERPCGTLPNNDAILARWSRMSPDRWTEVKPHVLDCFTLLADNRWHQKRMELEYRKLAATSTKRRIAGARGAKAKWQKHGPANGPARNLPMQSQCDPEYESDSESGFEFENENGRAREAAHDPPDLSPASQLAAQWCGELTRRKGGYPVDRPSDMESQFSELLRQGTVTRNPSLTFDRIMAEIKKINRDRNEHFWQFLERLTGKSSKKRATNDGRRYRFSDDSGGSDGQTGTARDAG